MNITDSESFLERGYCYFIDFEQLLDSFLPAKNPVYLMEQQLYLGLMRWFYHVCPKCRNCPQVRGVIHL